MNKNEKPKCMYTHHSQSSADVHGQDYSSFKKGKVCCNFISYCTLAPWKAGGGINTKTFFPEIQKIFTNKNIAIRSLLGQLEER